MTNRAYSDKVISVIMPTFRRPEGLARALKSLSKQHAPGHDIEIIIADNSPEATARKYVREFGKTSPHKVVYVHAEIPGVSNARNAAVAASSGRYIAWLDDDQEAADNWIFEMMATARDCAAAMVFCPTHAILETQTSSDAQYVKFFSRLAAHVRGPIEEFFGCGNSLMDCSKFTLPDPVFDPLANETGGEDDLLFTQIQKQGVITAWTPDTYTQEYIPAGRTNPEYVRKRALAWGQGPSEIARDDNDTLALIKWMCIGTLQMAAYSVPMLATKVIKHPSHISWLRKFWEGAGKVFWSNNLRPKLYGASSPLSAANKA